MIITSSTKENRNMVEVESVLEYSSDLDLVIYLMDKIMLNVVVHGYEEFEFDCKDTTYYIQTTIDEVVDSVPQDFLHAVGVDWYPYCFELENGQRNLGFNYTDCRYEGLKSRKHACNFDDLLNEFGIDFNNWDKRIDYLFNLYDNLYDFMNVKNLCGIILGNAIDYQRFEVALDYQMKVYNILKETRKIEGSL